MVTLTLRSTIMMGYFLFCLLFILSLVFVNLLS